MTSPQGNSPRTRLIAALDTASRKQALDWAAQLAGTVDAIKVGMEFVYACGFDAVRDLSRRQPVFLDLKLHDIPNTVGKGIASLADTGACLVTVHASGGAEMVSAAKRAITATFPKDRQPDLIAVTVLTSMDVQSLNAVGVMTAPEQQVIRLADVALGAGADGLVCSAREIVALRQKFGRKPVLVVPGIRPEGAQMDDQKRVMTPREAAKMGADWIVVGRPITRASDPARAAAAIQDEMRLTT